MGNRVEEERGCTNVHFAMYMGGRVGMKYVGRRKDVPG